MKTTALSLGLIGAGARGRLLASLAEKSHRPRARIVACCDPSPRAQAEFRRVFGSAPAITDNIPDFLAHDLDAVIISSPDFLHEAQAVAALARGIAVYLEKPIAITLRGADRVLAAAMQSGAKLYVGHNMRHMAFVAKMKELIDAGAIGEVKACWARHFVGNGGDYYFRDWHAERRYSTGLLLQKAAHDIDVIHWLCGGYARRVHAFGALTVYDKLPRRKAERRPHFLDHDAMKHTVFPATRATALNPRIDVEDLSSLAMQLDNGVLVTYAQCHFTPDYWRSYTVIGTEGRLENFGNGERGTHLALWNRRHAGYAARPDRVFPIPFRSGTHGGADPRIIGEFLHYVARGGATTTSPLAARESVAAGFLATQSLRNDGRMYPVPPPAPELVRYFGGASTEKR